MLDKTKVPDVKVVKAIFRTVAKFHGAWTKALMSDKKFPQLTFTKKDLQRNLCMPVNFFLKTIWAGKYAKADIVDLKLYVFFNRNSQKGFENGGESAFKRLISAG